MSRSLARTAVLAALAAVLAVLGVAPAMAVTTAPAPGTQRCTDAVNGVSAVINAKTTLVARQDALQGALNQLAIDKAKVPYSQATVDADQVAVNNAQVFVAAAQRLYNSAVATATRVLCTGTAPVTTAPATTNPAATFPPFVPNGRGVAEISVAIDNLNCASTAVDLQRINDAINARALAGKNVTGLKAHLQDKVAQLACKAGPVTVVPPTIVVPPTTVVAGAPTTVTEIAPGAVAAQRTAVVTSKMVVATADDGSVATTSGSQVGTVPSGSVQTGAA